jgi:hypothetical protein
LPEQRTGEASNVYDTTLPAFTRGADPAAPAASGSTLSFKEAPDREGWATFFAYSTLR